MWACSTATTRSAAPRCKGTARELARRGLKLAKAPRAIHPATHDLAQQIAALRHDGVELVVLGAVPQETLRRAGPARRMRWYPAFLCPSACYVPEAATLGGRAVDGALFGGDHADPLSRPARPRLARLGASLRTSLSRRGLAAGAARLSGRAAVRRSPAAQRAAPDAAAFRARPGSHAALDGFRSMAACPWTTPPRTISACMPAIWPRSRAAAGGSRAVRSPSRNRDRSALSMIEDDLPEFRGWLCLIGGHACLRVRRHRRPNGMPRLASGR